MKKILLLFGLVFLFLCSFVTADLDDHLVAYYDMENGNTSVGSDNLAVTSVTFIDTGETVHGKYANFASSTGYLENLAVDYKNFGSHMTVNVWMNNNNIVETNARTFLDARKGGGLDMISDSHSPTPFNMRFKINSGVYLTDGSTFRADGWNMITLVYNGTHQIIYTNGTATVSRVEASSSDALEEITLGISGADHTSSNFDGYMDEIGFWNYSLTPEQILSLYSGNGGLPFFYPFTPTPSDNFSITANTFYFNTPITNFNASINGIKYVSNNSEIVTGILINDTSLYNITLSSNNHDDKIYLNHNVTINLLANLTYSYYKLNVTALDFIENTSINNFTVTIDSTDYTTSNGTVIIDVEKNQPLTVFIDSFGYALANQSLTVTTWEEDLEFSLYPHNSISISIRDESTNALITQNVTMLFSSPSGDFSNYTLTGIFLIEDLEPEEYDITFSSEDYKNRIFTVTVSNRSHQSLTAYLTKSTDTTIFTIKDKDTAELLEGVESTMYRTINGTWQPVETKSSDITGRVQFNYEPSIEYRFYLSLNTYEDLIFYLNPILFSTYNIGLQSEVLDNSSPDYNDLSLIFSDDFEQGTNTFNYLTQSPSGVLIDYGYNLTYKNTSIINSGVNLIGEQLTSILNITNPSSFDRVELNYYYESTTSDGRREFKTFFPITINEYNNTMVSNKDKTYGLGLLERILTITLIGIFVLGFASLIGKPIQGLILVLFLWSFFVYIGFIEWWIVAISFFVSIILLGRGD